ncbi:molybdopterin-dependent oxidoreductase [Nonomuraea sp. NBC_00507]|uniref:molybdopterin cofactor-binding domain-containing protein n=1 Tax=Nonomuraea sp. NBC_00507 TaxID=2976002 RepID=UPI002E19A1C0
MDDTDLPAAPCPQQRRPPPSARVLQPGEKSRFSMYGYAARFAEVAVDARLGLVRRRIGVYDAGRIISLKLADSQAIGGMVGGIGVAPAIANAVFHATGRRLRDLPITAEALL